MYDEDDREDDLEDDEDGYQGRTTLRVENITDEVSPRDLAKLFSKHGKVVAVRVHSLEEAVAAFVTMSSRDAKEAREWLDGNTWRGHKLSVKTDLW